MSRPTLLSAVSGVLVVPENVWVLMGRPKIPDAVATKHRVMCATWRKIFMKNITVLALILNS